MARTLHFFIDRGEVIWIKAYQIFLTSARSCLSALDAARRCTGSGEGMAKSNGTRAKTDSLSRSEELS